MKSPWQEYCGRWANGCGSDECAGARNIVLAKGQIPCDLLFVGEAPGESEDVLGRPFCGPAGQLLDRIVLQSIPSAIRVAYTNLVGCIPREVTLAGNSKAAEPLPEQIEQCQPRLKEFIDLANPRLIICVGALANLWLSQDYKKRLELGRFIPRVNVTHPAAVLRADPVWKGIMVQKITVEIQTAVEEYLQ